MLSLTNLRPYGSSDDPNRAAVYVILAGERGRRCGLLDRGFAALGFCSWETAEALVSAAGGAIQARWPYVPGVSRARWVHVDASDGMSAYWLDAGSNQTKRYQLGDRPRA